MSPFIRAALRLVLQWACRSPLVARLLFRVKFLPPQGAHYYFDITTYVLTRFLRERLHAEDRVLDLGTGSAAIVSLYLWRHVGCELLAADVNPAIVAMARKAIAHNEAPVNIVESDLLSRISWPFNVIVFNPPYVPTPKGESLRLSLETRSQWNGGPTGTMVMERFLDQVERLSRPVTIYMGINTMYLEDLLVQQCIGARAGLLLAEIYRPRHFPSRIYVMRNQRGSLPGQPDNDATRYTLPKTS